MRWQRAFAMGATVVLAAGLATAIAPTRAMAADPTPEELAVTRANAAIDRNPTAVNHAAEDRYQVWGVRVMPTGTAHVRYTRLYHGLQVRGGDFVVHLTAAGDLDEVSMTLDAPVAVDPTPKVSADDAARAATEALRASGVTAPALFVDAIGGTGRLAWQMTAQTADGAMDASVDATEGRLLRAVPLAQPVQGTGHGLSSGTVTLETKHAFNFYSLIDPTRGNASVCDLKHATSGPCPTYVGGDNDWGDGNPLTSETAAVEAAYGAANTFDFYKNVLGRNGIYGDGTGVPSHVHRGNNWQNAHWDSVGQVMEYGDNVGNDRPIIELDVAAHEMTHGVTEHVVPGGLNYSSESGGLNEATSDIMGTMAEFYANNSTNPPDYLIGENIDYFGNGDPLRYMYHPSLDGPSHNCWTNSTPNVDVHYSSGVANHFFFMLAQGSGFTSYGNSPPCNLNSSVTGIGREKATQIWWHALADYFGSDETYADARTDTLAAAADLYGKCGTEYAAVANAWAAVNVGSPYSLALCIKIKIKIKWIEIQWPIPDPGPLKWVTETTEPGALSTVEVGVNIVHPRAGDLQISLVTPDGATYRLKEADPRDTTADVADVYRVRLREPAAAGQWTLLVEDVVRGEAGQLKSFSLAY